ncbi:MAG: transposase [Myxococcales bacterium]|nr:transposase [Myxococcales bacterium]
MTATARSSLGEVTDVTEKAKRRAFTVEYKGKIVKEARRARNRARIGALLRREGAVLVPADHLAAGAGPGELAPGAAAKKRGPKAEPVDPRDTKIADLERQIANLTTRAERADAIAEIKKHWCHLETGHTWTGQNRRGRAPG